MNSLLGNYLSLGDLIVVHMCGIGRNLSLKKAQDYLGLTITDNGHGRAFVKKVKSSDGLIEKLIKPGDHIASINSESTIGMRHYEVAKLIREVPHQAAFTMYLIEPLKPFAGGNHNFADDSSKQIATDLRSDSSIRLELANGTTSNTTAAQIYDKSLDHSSHLDSIYEDLANSSLPIDRLLSSKGTGKDGKVTSSDNSDTYRRTIERINSILDSILGINDNILAIQIYRLAKENRDSFKSFVNALKTSELNVFEFGEDIQTYLWNCVTDSVTTSN